MTAKRDISDQQLWQSFLDGDDQSLEEIYRKFFDDLYRYGKKWLSDAFLTEDVIQDLFIKLIRNRKNLSSVTSIKYYLFKAFRSIALDKLRSEGKVNLENDLSSENFPLYITPEHLYIEKEEFEAIRQKLSKAINQLTPRQREAIFLKYIEGFSYSEVSEMMDLSVKGTYKLMARAVEALKSQIPLSILYFQLLKNYSLYFS